YGNVKMPARFRPIVINNAQARFPPLISDLTIADDNVTGTADMTTNPVSKRGAPPNKRPVHNPTNGPASNDNTALDTNADHNPPPTRVPVSRNSQPLTKKMMLTNTAIMPASCIATPAPGATSAATMATTRPTGKNACLKLMRRPLPPPPASPRSSKSSRARAGYAPATTATRPPDPPGESPGRSPTAPATPPRPAPPNASAKNETDTCAATSAPRPRADAGSDTPR